MEEAHSILRETVGPDDSRMGDVHLSKGNCLFRGMGRVEEARAAYEESLRIYRIVYTATTSHHVASSLGNLGNVCLDMDMLVDARDNFEEALRIKRRERGERHPHVASLFNIIGRVLFTQGEYDEALKMHKKALKIIRRVLGEDHEDLASTLRKIGLIYNCRCGYSKAIEMFDEALGVRTRALGPGTVDRLSASLDFALAWCKHSSGDAEGALESARESVRIYNLLGIDDEYSQESARLLRDFEGGDYQDKHTS